MDAPPDATEDVSIQTANLTVIPIGDSVNGGQGSISNTDSSAAALAVREIDS
jgi:hypothetical protein